MPKFISELDPHDPADVEEMKRHVFGQNYKEDQEGNPVVAGRGSIAHMRSGKHADSLEQHFRMIGKYEGEDAEKKARAEYESKYAKQAERARELHRQSKVPKREVEVEAF
jgi:hypothetical protein